MSEKVVERLFKAMQMGPGGEEDLMGLFAENAVFVEPFAGQPRTHEGKEAIRGSFRDMWSEPESDLRLVLDRVDVDGAHLRAEWTCTSSAFPTAMKGHDLFTIDNGLISRLEIIVTEMPPMGPPE